MLSSLFRKPKDVINFEQKRGLVYQISCRDCNAVYVGETGRGVRTRKREYADAVKNFPYVMFFVFYCFIVKKPLLLKNFYFL